MTDMRPDPGLEESILTFAEGIPGFAEHTRFLLVTEVEDSAFQMLQSVDDPEVAIIVTVPWLFFPEYSPDIPDSEAASLGIQDPDDVILFCGVSIDAENDAVYINLLGPFVVNAATRQGRQLVLTEGDHPSRALVDLGDL